VCSSDLEIEQARMGWRENQRMLADQFCGPVYRWQVLRALSSGAIRGNAVQKALAQGTLYRASWRGSGWPYVNPEQDARADTAILDRGLESPTMLQQRRGRDYEVVLAETVRDNGAAIREAARAAAELNADFPGAQVTWRDVLRPFASADATAPHAEPVPARETPHTEPDDSHRDAPSEGGPQP
jgi:capsid protein